MEDSKFAVEHALEEIDAERNNALDVWDKLNDGLRKIADKHQRYLDSLKENIVKNQ